MKILWENVNFALSKCDIEVKRTSAFRIILSVFMLVLFLSYQASTTLFTHTHIIDGRVITHSHPYDSQAHSHSDAQIFALGHVSLFAGEDLDDNELKFVAYEVIDEIGNVADAVLSLFVSLDSHGFRAPPVCC